MKFVVTSEFAKAFLGEGNYTTIEKARRGEQVGGKYMYREEIAEKVKTSKGKIVVTRYKYYYIEDMLKDSAEKILKKIGKFFFKGNDKEVERIDKIYEKEDIKKNYGADKKTWYQHFMEYLCHKSKWDKRFADKEVSEKFKKPIKQKVAEKITVAGMETAAEEEPKIKTKREKKEPLWKPNPSLMRKVWSMYNEVKPSKSEIDTGDTIELNNDTVEKPGYTDGEKAAIALAYRKEKDFDPTMSDYHYYEKIKAKFPELEEKGGLYSTMLEVKDMMFNESRLKAAKDYLNSLINKENIQTETENANTTESTEITVEPRSEAIDYYVSGDGMWINKYLRNPEQFEKENGAISEQDKQIIKDLDSETTLTPITDKKLYRAVDASAIFGNVSDIDFENLVAHIVHGDNQKLVVNNAKALINRAENKQVTELGFMSTTKDKDIANNWDGFTGSNKEVILELDVPNGMTGKDLAAYDIEGDEQKEVLLPRNLDYFIKNVTTNENGKLLVQAQILGTHGNHIAMLGNQNAKKYSVMLDTMLSDISAKLNSIRTSSYTDKQKEAFLRDTYSDLVKPITDIVIMNTKDKETASSELKEVIEFLQSKVPENEKKLINTNLNYTSLVEIRSNSVKFKLPKKNYKLEDLENGTVTVKEIFAELDNNGDSYTSEERLAMQQIVRDYINIHPDDFRTSHGYLETTDDWYVTEVMDQRRKYRRVWKDGEDLLETKQTILDYAKFKSAKILQDINVTNTEEIQLAMADVKDKIQEGFNQKQSTDERVKTKGELDALAYTMAYQELLRKEKEYVEKERKEGENSRNDGLTQDEADSLEYYVQDAGYNKTETESNNMTEPTTETQNSTVDGLSLDTDLIANANNSSYMYEAGDAINREYLGGIEAINSWDLTDEEKQKAKQKLFELTTEQLKAQAKAISVTVAGPARKVSGSDKAFDKVQKIRGEIKELLDTLRAKNNANVQKQEMKDFTSAATEAMNNNKLAFVYDGKVYYRGNTKSSSWSEINHIPEVDETKTVDEKKKELKKLKEESKNLGFANPEKTKILNRIENLKNEIAYMNTDEWQNRHNAMLGNQNAAKPFSEEETKKEQKKVKETREKAGLPKIGINYGERVSAMEDSVSLNPNAENYAYKDTGYIAGSQKEKIQDFWKRKKESGEGTNIEEIDWNTLEENPRYAEQQITKSNILGNIDYNSFREKGMDSRAAYLASRVFAAIPKEPIGRDVTARKNYVIAINTVKERLSGCKTLYDVKEFVDDVYGEYKQTFDSQILRVPEVNKLTQERDGIIKEKNKIRESVMEWCRNELVPKYKDLGKKERKALWRYREELKKEISDKIREFDPNYNNPNMYIDIDTSNMWWPVNVSSEGILQEKIDKAYNKLKTARENAKNIIMNNNVTYEVWKELGDFADLRYSKTFQKHYNNLTVYDEKQATKPNGEIYEPYAYKYRDKEYDKYEDWDWVDKKTNKKAKPESEIIGGKVKRTFEMIVPETIERVGGRNVSVKSTEELKKAFNFRDIQTGSYVQSDPVSAKWHTDNLASGFADLCDILGIRDDQVSLNGRLALAIGARGHGRALAHYEPVERVINITKMRGGGSLGHEWFHAFDNMITEAMNGGNYAVYMSNPYRQSKRARLIDIYNSPNALYDPIPTDNSTQLVKSKFENLVKAMMEGDTPETEVITYKSTDVETAKKFFEKDLPFQAAYYSYGNDFYKKLANAKTLDDAISVINERYKDTVNLIYYNSEKISRMGKYEQKRMKDTVKNYEKYRTMAVAYFDSKTDKSNGGEVYVKTGRIVSRFYEDAKRLDDPNGEGKKAVYWSTPHEMAARAFEAYLVDKLKEKGQKNDYLSGHADNTVYLGEWFPYPTEKDRVKINKAFDELFEVIRNENAIRKSLDILKNREESKQKDLLTVEEQNQDNVNKSHFTDWKAEIKAENETRVGINKAMFFIKNNRLYFNKKNY